LVVDNLSLAVSADDERGLVIDGRRRSHIIDPRSGAPVVGRRATLVAASTALEADGWSTALHVLGAEGLERLESRGCAALVVDEDGTSRSNAAFQRLVASRAEADDGA
jgi:thiamine biosynthesis lipoprotein